MSTSIKERLITGRWGIWPSIRNLNDAKLISRNGIYGCLFAAISTIVLGLAAKWTLIVGGLYLIISFGVIKYSRVSAILGLILWFIAEILLFITPKRLPNYDVEFDLILNFLVILFFIHSIRATFLIHGNSEFK